MIKAIIIILIVLLILFAVVWFLSEHVDIGYVKCLNCDSDLLINNDEILTCTQCGKSFPLVEIKELIEDNND